MESTCSFVASSFITIIIFRLLPPAGWFVLGLRCRWVYGARPALGLRKEKRRPAERLVKSPAIKGSAPLRARGAGEGCSGHEALRHCMQFVAGRAGKVHA